jgi:hypothetical protein
LPIAGHREKPRCLGTKDRPTRCFFVHAKERKETSVSIIWFIVWLIADHIGDHAPLLFNPPNVWATTLLLVVALDINRPQILPRRGK